MSLPIGLPEILIILLIAIIIFGPKKIPELARALGQAVKEFKKASRGLTEEEEERVEEKKPSLEGYREIILELAKKMNIETKDKDLSVVAREVIEKAKEEGIYKETAEKLEKLKSE